MDAHPTRTLTLPSPTFDPLTEVRVLACALESLDASQRPARLASGIRECSLPFLPAIAALTDGSLVAATFDAQFTLGTVEFATALGLARHAAASIALTRASDDDPFAEARAAFARRLAERRQLLVDAIDPRDGIVPCVHEHGLTRAVGSRPLVPFAELGDVLLVSAQHPTHGIAVLPLELRRNPRVAFGPSIALDPLRSTHLRTLLIRGQPVDDGDWLFALDGIHARRFLELKRALCDTFTAATLLGAAQRALEEARAVLLRAVDRNVAEMNFGRLIVRERSAALAAFQARDRIVAVLAPRSNGFEIDRASIAAASAREEVGRMLGEVALGALRLVGHSAFATSPALIRIVQSLALISLDEVPGDSIDRAAGRDFLRRAE